MPRLDHERRKRRIFRLSLLGGILLLLIGLGLYAVNKTSDDVLSQQKFEDSRVAYEQGDYARVVALLEDRQSTTNTIRAIQRNPEALYLYVKARREVTLNNGEHIALLFPALRQLVALDPSNREAGVMLLQIQLLYGQESNALTTSTRLIEVHPKDGELLQYRAAVYEKMGRTREALDDIWAALELNPLDVRAGADAARLTTAMNGESDRFVAWANKLVTQFPQDPRALVFQGQARLLEKDRLQAEQSFIAAANLPPTDNDFAEVMVQWLERIDRYDLALKYLENHASPGFDNRLSEELLYRQFENSTNEQVVSRFLAGDRASAETDLIAVVALSARRAGRSELADQLHTSLSQGNTHAKNWAKVLEASWSSPINPGALITAADAALQLRPNNPHLSYILGSTLMDVGEFEAALPHLRTSASVRSSWAQPLYLSARIALLYGEPGQAAELAQSALQREPNIIYADLEAAARAYQADVRDPDQVTRAVRRVESVQEQSPGAPRSLLALVDLHRRANDRSAARQALMDALTLEPPLDQATLIELARQADGVDPALAVEVRDRTEALYGKDAQLSLDRAISLATAGKADEGAALLRAQMPDPAGLEWQRALAEYLTVIRSPDAVAAWIRVADAFPGDLVAQSRAVDRVPLGEHPAFAARAITRMRAIGGEESVGWRIARARLLLTGTKSGAPEAVNEAGTLLREALEVAPNRADALRLMSRVYELTGDPVNAITAMQKAENIDPGIPAAQFRLGQMLHQQKRYRESQTSLIRVANSPDAPLDLRMNAMLMLGQQGELKVLIPIAKGIVATKVGGVRAQILLTELYLADGQFAEAQQMAEQLLQAPAPESIAYLSEYFERTNQPERAERTLALLDTVEMSQSERSEIRGLFASRRNDMESALGHFRAAAEAAPDQPRRWRTLVQMDLLFNQPAVAIQDAERGKSLGINDAGIAAVLANQELLSTLAVDARFARLAASVVSDDAHREVSLQALKTILEAAEQRTPLDEVANTLTQQAEATPEFLPLQIAAIQLLFQADLHAEAADLALQTMERFPSDSESARLAALSLNNSNDWRRSAIAAAQWGQRAPEYRSYAAILLASAQRNMGRYDDALKTLQPYVDAALRQPDDNFALLREYAWALALRGEIDQAWSIIQPQLTTAPPWREFAGQLAAEVLPNATAATAWLAAIEPNIPTDNLGERLILAQGEYKAANRLNSPELLDRAHKRVEQVLTRTDAPIEALFLQGDIATARGELRQAEESYRKLLQASPQTHLAMNNLAMVILARGQDSAAAVRFAESATRAQPNEPNYFDTLAQAYLANRELDNAVNAINRAIELDRFSSAWFLTKADILEARGDLDGATVLRERYQPRP